MCPVTGQIENKMVWEMQAYQAQFMICGDRGYGCDDYCSIVLSMSAVVAYKIKKIIDISEFLRKYDIAMAVLLGIGIIALIVYMIML